MKFGICDAAQKPPGPVVRHKREKLMCKFDRPRKAFARDEPRKNEAMQRNVPRRHRERLIKDLKSGALLVIVPSEQSVDKKLRQQIGPRPAVFGQDRVKRGVVGIRASLDVGYDLPEIRDRLSLVFAINQSEHPVKLFDEISLVLHYLALFAKDLDDAPQGFGHLRVPEFKDGDPFEQMIFVVSRRLVRIVVERVREHDKQESRPASNAMRFAERIGRPAILAVNS